MRGGGMGERVIYQTIFNSISRFKSSYEGRLRMSQMEMGFFAERGRDRVSEKVLLPHIIHSLKGNKMQ